MHHYKKVGTKESLVPSALTSGLPDQVGRFQIVSPSSGIQSFHLTLFQGLDAFASTPPAIVVVWYGLMCVRTTASIVTDGFDSASNLFNRSPMLNLISNVIICASHYVEAFKELRRFDIKSSTGAFVSLVVQGGL